jgi:hypothetical protein
MKQAMALLAMASLFGGCASYPSNPPVHPNGTVAGGWLTPNGVPLDPTYPGAGPYGSVGVGAGAVVGSGSAWASEGRAQAISAPPSWKE